MVETKALLPIHTLWVGERLGPLGWLCLTSWVKQGHPVTLHVYDEIAAPEGVTLVDAAKLMPREAIFRDRRTKNLAAFSDVFRVAILRAHDAVWLDADIFLLQPFDFPERNILSAEGRPGDATINNAAMRLAPEHPILQEIWKRYRNPWAAAPWDRPRKLWSPMWLALRYGGLRPEHLRWGALGFRAIDQVIRREGFVGLVLGAERSITPITVSLFEPIDDAEARLAPPAVYAHIYRSNAVADLARPKPGSIYAKLWERAGLVPDAPPGTLSTRISA